MNYTELSKTISHALRHEPWLYELELDDEGWTNVENVLIALRCEKPAWESLVVDDLRKMIEQSEKKRFEIQGTKMRAFYGHSIPGRLHKTPAQPPQFLFHGTSPSNIGAIRISGLRPMQRQFVHLSADVATAMNVGRRKAKTPIILQIRAEEAHTAGTKFYLGNESVWLADGVTPEFIEFPA